MWDTCTRDIICKYDTEKPENDIIYTTVANTTTLLLLPPPPPPRPPSCARVMRFCFALLFSWLCVCVLYFVRYSCECVCLLFRLTDYIESRLCLCSRVFQLFRRSPTGTFPLLVSSFVVVRRRRTHDKETTTER